MTEECNYSPSLAGECIVCSLVNIGEQVEGVKDSKLLSTKQKIALFPAIFANSLYDIQLATPKMIEMFGIYKARNLAMKRSLCNMVEFMDVLGLSPEGIILDGYWSKEKLEEFDQAILSRYPISGVIAADRNIYEVSAASIIGRLYCDALFEGWSVFFPGYNLQKNHGGESEEHSEALRKLGPTVVHRHFKNYAVNWWKKILEKVDA